MQKRYRFFISVMLVIAYCLSFAVPAAAQTAPSKKMTENYRGLHKAAHEGDVSTIHALIAKGANLEARDQRGRTAVHVAVFAAQHAALRALAKAGADLNALENQAYDIVTIAAVKNDLALVDFALSLGAKPGNVTSPYDGTALIAAAHLGHHEVVERLIAAGAPLNHVNNLGWTALIEAVVLGDGGSDHIATVRTLVAAGADQSIADRQGVTPLAHAQKHGFTEIVALLK